MLCLFRGSTEFCRVLLDYTAYLMNSLRGILSHTDTRTLCSIGNNWHFDNNQQSVHIVSMQDLCGYFSGSCGNDQHPRSADPVTWFNTRFLVRDGMKLNRFPAIQTEQSMHYPNAGPVIAQLCAVSVYTHTAVVLYLAIWVIRSVSESTCTLCIQAFYITNANIFETRLFSPIHKKVGIINCLKFHALYGVSPIST